MHITLSKGIGTVEKQYQFLIYHFSQIEKDMAIRSQSGLFLSDNQKIFDSTFLLKKLKSSPISTLAWNLPQTLA